MRIALLAASAVALTLAACGDSATESGKMTESQVADEIAESRTLTPGQYQASFQITRFDMPGVPAAAQQQMRDMMTSAAQVQQSYCLTEEQAQRGSRDMFRELSRGNGDCSFTRFDVDGEDVRGEMTCTAEGGGQATMVMTGTMGDNSSEMTMVTDITDASLPQGRAQMEMKVDTRRTGDCTAQSRAAAEAQTKATGE